MNQFELPHLDTHAHVAPDVTRSQLNELGRAHIFAMTRTLDEAEAVCVRDDAMVTWGLGVHPGRADALHGFEHDRFVQLLKSFAVVGEVGLDKRGHADLQGSVFSRVLSLCSDQPVILSIHTAGRVNAALESLRVSPQRGAVLHWFLGSTEQLHEAVRLGAYFSVNAAMPTSLLSAVPGNRVLTETDFPARRSRARRPGDTNAIEEVLAECWRVPPDVVRHRVWANLKRLLLDTGAIDRVGEAFADTALSV